MMKCPYCGADIQENATFCLYCMTSLDQKTDILPKRPAHKRMRVAVAVTAAVVAAIAFVAVLVMQIGKTIVFYASFSAKPESPPQIASTSTGRVPIASTSTAAPIPSVSQTIPSSTASTETIPSSEPEPTEPTLPPEEVFTFRHGLVHDYWNPNDDTNWNIIITGVKVQQEVYYIPDSIYDPVGGENRVAGIAAGAFEGSGAKVIYTSSYLFVIHEDAFKGCHLTDLYLAGRRVDLHPNAYASLETLHTQYDSHPGPQFGGGQLFREIAESVYHAKWEEWLY